MFVEYFLISNPRAKIGGRTMPDCSEERKKIEYL